MVAPKVPLYLRKRYYVMMALFVGQFIEILVKINLSICIVEITSKKAVTVGNTTIYQEPELNLTSIEKGVVLSAHSWGFIASPVGALISNKFGGVRIFCTSLLCTGLCSILSPPIIQWGLNLFILVRVAEGFFLGAIVGAMANICVKWVIPNERIRMINIALLGISTGAALSHPITGFITYLFNWKYVFYITGTMSLLWFVVVCFTIENSPLDDKIITKAEKELFREVGEQIEQEKIIIPWRSILTSTPVLALWNERFVESWSYSFFLTCLPLYINDIYPANIKDLGLVSSVPHLLAMLSIIVFSWLMEFLRVEKKMNKSKVHKTFIMFGQVPAACLLISLGFWTNFYFVIIICSIFKICYSAAYASYYTLPYDMSLLHANLLQSIGVSISGIGYIVNPIVMGFMVPNRLPEEWSRYFWFLSIFNLWSFLIFAKYGSGERQPWAQLD